MTNFSIKFSNPWLLLLLIPAVALTFIPYFRMNKRYRGTRNRIVSMVLHLIIMTLAISLLAGITFEYDLPNDENEVILLVDASYSGSKLEDEKDSFIQTVMRANESGTFKLGIVTFGYDQVYSLKLTSDMKNAYSKYMSSEMPNTSATDIEAALKYTAELFTKPENGRIVLMSDAIETDGNAYNAIKTVAAKGIKVDTVDFTDGKRGDEVQIISMTRPDTKIKFAEEFTVELTLQSSYTGEGTLNVYNDGSLCGNMDVEFIRGLQTIKIPLTFDKPNPNNLHTLSFELTSNNDTLDLNNTFHSYILVESFNKILILESIDGESAAIQRMLGVDFDITAVNIDDTNNVPASLDAIRLYDQVILCNVSYGQMPEGFEKILYEYVADIGGGLFTVCGTETDGETPNAFTKEDLKPSQYLKKLLPVDVINFTPPVAVMILIDKSGSMYSEDFNTEFETSKLYYALQGARACLDLLSERDYIGVYELDDYYEEALELTPATERAKVLNTIQNIGKDGGGTVFSTALAAAGKALKAQTNVEKKHIIVITDGEPDSTDINLTKEVLHDNAAYGITTSIIGIQCNGDAESLMKQLLVEYAGVEEKNFHNVRQNDSVPDAVRDDMSSPEIREMNYTEFQIQIGDIDAFNEMCLQGWYYIDPYDFPFLDGFYGMKAKDAEKDGDDMSRNLAVILRGEYTPIYTQWEYGKGKVGTFGCDLNGTWSSDFVNTDYGTQLLRGMIQSLMPNEDISPTEITVSYNGNNVKTEINVSTTLADGEFIEISILCPSDIGESIQKFSNIQDENVSVTFNAITPGVYRIIVQKKDASGFVIAKEYVYKAFSYSKEYDVYYDCETAQALLESIASATGGKTITEPAEVFVFD